MIGEIEFYPICDECIRKVLQVVMEHFSVAQVTYQELGKHSKMYHLSIVVGIEE